MQYRIDTQAENQIMPTSLLDGALYWNRRGFPVLPLWWANEDGTCACGDPNCKSIAKHPLGMLAPNGCFDATTDPAVIEVWWGLYPKANIGLAMGHGRVAIDLDVKKDANGLATFLDLNLFFDTLTHRTPSGGWHLIYTAEEDFANNVRLLPAIDVRSSGGYIAAPPSVAPDGVYSIEVDMEPEPVPAMLAALLHPPQAEQNNDVLTGEDSPVNIDLMIAKAKTCVPSFEGRGGDNQLYSVAACMCRDYALTVDTATSILWEFYNPRCVPKWEDYEFADFRKTVFNGAQYGRNAIGGKSPERMLEFVKPTTKARPACPQNGRAEPAAAESPQAIAGTAPKKKGVVARRLDDVEAEPIEWAWKDHIAYGKLNLIGGPPGVGKSQLLLKFAAIITTGDKWPDGNACRKNAVALIQNEDNAGDTVKPRAMAAGVDGKNFHILDGICVDEGAGLQERLLQLDRDLADIEAWLDDNPDVGTLMIDPVTAYLGKTDSYKDTEVRAVLTPLATLAERRCIMVIVLAHLNKSSGRTASDRIAGSPAFNQVPRTGHMIAPDPDDEDLMVFQSYKRNIGKKSEALLFRIVSEKIYTEKHPKGIDTSRVALEGMHARIDLDEALNGSQGKPEKVSKLEQAKAWLKTYLENGPQFYPELFEAAKANCIAKGTLDKAKAELEVVSRKGLNRWAEWEWALPGDNRTAAPPVAGIHPPRMAA